MLTRLLLLAILTVGAHSHGAGLAGTEAKLVHILAKLQEPGAADPTFRCFHIGRLQATSELLTGNLKALQARPHRTLQDNELLQRGKQLRFGMAKILQRENGSCSFVFQEKAGGIPEADLLHEISTHRKKMRGTGAEDPVLKCFHLGRLSIWTGGLKRMIAKKTRKGEAIDRKALHLLDTTDEFVDKESATSCKPAAQPRTKSIEA